MDRLNEKQLEALRKVVDYLAAEIELFAIQVAEGGSGRREAHIGQAVAILKAFLRKSEVEQ